MVGRVPKVIRGEVVRTIRNLCGASILILLLECGCTGNAIFFDERTQSVRSCEGETIDKLSIEAEEGIMHLKLTKDEGTQFFLFQPNPGYVVESTYPNTIDTIIFRPGRKYRIMNRSASEATSEWLEIEIRRSGTV